MHSIKLLATIIAASAFGTASAQSLDIKGLRIGMSRSEVSEKLPSTDDFTIAGVASKYPEKPLGLSFHEDKLDRLTFFFASGRFETVLDALKEKYPTLRCETSSITNAAGGKFDQVYCAIGDLQSTISIVRFASNTSTSALGMNSKRLLDEMERLRQTKKKEI